MGWFATLLAGGASAACWVLVRRARQLVPFTGRRHFILLPERMERAMAAKALDGLLEERRRAGKGRPLRDGHRDVKLVRAVGARVIAALDAAVASGHWAPFNDAHKKAASTKGGQQTQIVSRILRTTTTRSSTCCLTRAGP